MKLKTDFKYCVAGNHGAVFVRTDEPDEALASIIRDCKTNGWHFWRWDVLSGLTKSTPGVAVAATGSKPGRAADPLADKNNNTGGPAGAIRAIAELTNFNNVTHGKDGEDRTPTILVLHNLHLVAAGNIEVRQAIMNVVFDFKGENKMIVGLGHASSELPPELMPLCTIIDHELPEADDFAAILDSYISNESCAKLEQQVKDDICEAACGMTRLQFDNEVANQIAMSHGKGVEPVITSTGMWDRKCDILNTEGLVRVLKPKFGFDRLGGMTGMKKFMKDILNPQNADPTNPDMRANGVLLVSAPGMGKTQFIEAVAYELGCHAVMMDFGAMMGGIVGDTEKNTRRAFQIVESMAPKTAGKGRKWLIVGWDEIEKMLSQGDSGLDSGVGVRQLGYVLNWLSTRESRTFVIATANEARNLHAALTRAERFDALFYMEKPGRAQKDAIWGIYIKNFGLEKSAPCLVQRRVSGQAQYWNGKAWTGDINQATTYGTYTDAKDVTDDAALKNAAIVPKLPDDSDWTGAEIKSCCRLAAMQRKPIIEAATQIVPVFVRYKSNLDSLENWARGCCLSSETGKRFGATAEASDVSNTGQDKVRRRVHKLGDKSKPPAQDTFDDSDDEDI